jgi:hypothetical protein
LNQTQDFGIQSSERKLTQQTGQAELLRENKEETYQTIVFLPGPDSQDTFPSLEELTKSAPNEPVITDTGQASSQWLTDLFLDELLAPAEAPAQSALQGELNTPTIGKSCCCFLQGQWNIQNELTQFGTD